MEKLVGKLVKVNESKKLTSSAIKKAINNWKPEIESGISDTIQELVENVQMTLEEDGYELDMDEFVMIESELKSYIKKTI